MKYTIREKYEVVKDGYTPIRILASKSDAQELATALNEAYDAGKIAAEKFPPSKPLTPTL